jgi:DNA repair exonuclease SbcCD ATPase subunit
MEEAQRRQADLEQHIERSRADAESAHAEALREARQLIEEADQRAASIVSDAKTVAARIRADSERELAAATQRRDSINQQLANVRQMLTTLTGVAPTALMDHAMGGPGQPQQPEESPAADGEHQDTKPSAEVQAEKAQTAEADSDHTGGASEGDADEHEDDHQAPFTPLTPERVEL